MNRLRVQSSDIHSIGYDNDTEVLEIEFNNGGVYQYSHVPEHVYTELMNASSHGKFFHSHIKSKYSYQRLN